MGGSVWQREGVRSIETCYLVWPGTSECVRHVAKVRNVEMAGPTGVASNTRLGEGQCGQKRSETPI